MELEMGWEACSLQRRRKRERGEPRGWWWLKTESSSLQRRRDQNGRVKCVCVCDGVLERQRGLVRT